MLGAGSHEGCRGARNSNSRGIRFGGLLGFNSVLVAGYVVAIIVRAVLVKKFHKNRCLLSRGKLIVSATRPKGVNGWLKWSCSCLQFQAVSV